MENQKEKEREEKFRKENYERKRSKFSEGKFEKEEENEESAPKVKIIHWTLPELGTKSAITLKR